MKVIPAVNALTAPLPDASIHKAKNLTLSKTNSNSWASPSACLLLVRCSAPQASNTQGADTLNADILHREYDRASCKGITKPWHSVLWFDLVLRTPRQQQGLTWASRWPTKSLIHRTRLRAVTSLCVSTTAKQCWTEFHPLLRRWQSCLANRWGFLFVCFLPKKEPQMLQHFCPSHKQYGERFRINQTEWG